MERAQKEGHQTKEGSLASATCCTEPRAHRMVVLATGSVASRAGHVLKTITVALAVAYCSGGLLRFKVALRCFFGGSDSMGAGVREASEFPALTDGWDDV